ncbi:putative transport protein, major facilitator superfamily (MFS) of permeases [Serratia symbiotica str. 'Cinara cedri']|nr:putative transport protein, major facilitator superfamily (MFS) of permeases [Serratia symbiotica str. 'Cinara cedri']
MITTVHNKIIISPNFIANNNNTTSQQKVKCLNINQLPYIVPGTSQFIRVTLALFFVGIATFALLYCVQSILPVLSYDFSISPAQSSLSLSISTGLLAIGLIFTGPLSDAFGRKLVMAVALLLAVIFTLICALMVSWNGILLMRALIGLSLSGVAAIGITYLNEEIHPNFVAFSIGLYISGNSIGGISGRLITGVLTDFYSWRFALAMMSILSLAAVGIFWYILPTSKHFQACLLRPSILIINFKLYWNDEKMSLLCAEGFLLMGSFVTMFNYISYRLLTAPYDLSQSIVSLLSLAYLTGTYSSPKAGTLTSRFGCGLVLWVSIIIMLAGILITALSPLAIIFFGLVLFSTGFFAAHSVASSWVSMRAQRAKGQASSFYLSCYYIGSSFAGTIGGIFWHDYGWYGVIIFISIMLLIALSVAHYLKRCPESLHT